MRSAERGLALAAAAALLGAFATLPALFESGDTEPIGMDSIEVGPDLLGPTTDRIRVRGVRGASKLREEPDSRLEANAKARSRVAAGAKKARSGSPVGTAPLGERTLASGTRGAPPTAGGGTGGDPQPPPPDRPPADDPPPPPPPPPEQPQPLVATPPPTDSEEVQADDDDDDDDVEAELEPADGDVEDDEPLE